MTSSRASLSRRSAANRSSPKPNKNEAEQIGKPEKTVEQEQRSISTGPAPIAIDLGAFSIRISIGRDSKNSIITRCPNAIVRQQVQRRHPGISSGPSSLIGPQIHEKCTNFGSLTIRQPMDRGLVVDWQAQKAILDVALADALAKEKGSSSSNINGKQSGKLLQGRQVILTEAYFNLPDLQSAMDLILMEEYGAGSIWRCAPAYLIPYSLPLFSATIAGSGKKRQRPECMLIVDMGHSGTHTIPIVGDSIFWKAARRHVISQKLLTNLLKESLSFRQWDMMDEAWLVGHIKESCCFVASKSGRRGDTIGTSSPSQWSFAALVEMCESTSKQKNSIVQEYVLPDYANLSHASKYGYIRKGPGSSSADVASTEKLQKLNDDEFISDGATTKRIALIAIKDNENLNAESEDDADDSSDDDFDAKISGDDSGDDTESQRPKKKQKKGNKKGQEIKKGIPPKGHNEGEEPEQVLILERERFQVPEVMFNPGLIGLDDAPLQEVIRTSIEECDESIRGLMWSNICLVGGGAQMRGIKARLEAELRPLAPTDVPLHIWTSKEPAMDGINGAQSILTAPTGTAMHRMLKSRILPVEEYTQSVSRQRFGGWTSV